MIGFGTNQKYFIPMKWGNCGTASVVYYI